jgi:outer membrane protein
MLSKMSFRKSYPAPILGLVLAVMLLGHGPASSVHAAGPAAEPEAEPAVEPAAEPELSLAEAVRQAVASNLDLVTQRQALEADRQEIGLARSVLLPQLDFGARAQLLDDERSDELRGNNENGSVVVAAGLSQLLYDEGSWAGFSIQKHVFDGQVKQLESFRLAVIQEAADAFLELDSARHVLEIQEHNREITRENLDKTRALIAAGWSSDREILRWRSQLAGNDTDVRQGQVRVLQNQLELNRVRNRPPETSATLVPPTLADYGFVYADEAIAGAVADPAQDRRMRDFLVRAGIARSPDLAALDASIAAGERQLTANRRAFWVPTLSLGAGVDYLANQDSDSSFNQTEWGVRGQLAFPVFQGGAKFAGLEQARAIVDSLHTERRATAQSLEQTIRAAFAQATGSFESVGFAKRQVAEARKNFELVDQSYILGAASILDLLDAQELLLEAHLTLNNASYGFLEDLVAAERAISFYAFIHEPGDEKAILDGIALELRLHP